MKYLRIGAGAAVLILLRCYPNFSWGGVLGTVLCIAVLSYVAVRSTASGAELFVALVGLSFGSGALINLTEGALFDVIKVADVPVGLAWELLNSALMSAVIVFAVRPLRAESPGGSSEAERWSVTALLWRVLAGVCTFCACYTVAGMIIFPFVREYYTVRTMPPMGAIFSMQVLRALALMAVAFPVVRIIPSRKHARIALMMALPTLGGIAPLLPANPLMPAAVRLVHACEITPYYALYGFLLATWFGKKPVKSIQMETSSASTALV